MRRRINAPYPTYVASGQLRVDYASARYVRGKYARIIMPLFRRDDAWVCLIIDGDTSKGLTVSIKTRTLQKRKKLL